MPDCEQTPQVAVAAVWRAPLLDYLLFPPRRPLEQASTVRFSTMITLQRVSVSAVRFCRSGNSAPQSQSSRASRAEKILRYLPPRPVHSAATKPTVVAGTTILRPKSAISGPPTRSAQSRRITAKRAGRRTNRAGRFRAVGGSGCRQTPPPMIGAWASSLSMRAPFGAPTAMPHRLRSHRAV